jgi:hypothetical protein
MKRRVYKNQSHGPKELSKEEHPRGKLSTEILDGFFGCKGYWSTKVTCEESHCDKKLSQTYKKTD